MAHFNTTTVEDECGRRVVLHFKGFLEQLIAETVLRRQGFTIAKSEQGFRLYDNPADAVEYAQAFLNR